MNTISVIVVILAALLIWGVLTFNRLVGLRNLIANAWAQIDVQLKRRHDLIPNLVEVAERYLKHEQDTLQAVIAARGQAAGLLDAARACVETVHPKTAVVAHLQEIGHPIGYARWTYQDGLDEIAKIEAAGFHAIMPLWGDRLA